jgi:hypothetical protein
MKQTSLLESKRGGFFSGMMEITASSITLRPLASGSLVIMLMNWGNVISMVAEENT